MEKTGVHLFASRPARPLPWHQNQEQGGSPLKRALISTRESASATTLSTPWTCRITEVNCEM